MSIGGAWWWQGHLPILNKLITVSTAKFYSTVPIEVNSDYYEDRIPEGALPQIIQEVPEFFAGVELPKTSQFVLTNLDNAITTLRGNGSFKRGTKVIISKGYGSIKQGLISIDDAEVYTEYRGLIDSSSIGEEAAFPLLPADIDVFDKEFPFEKVTVDLWPNAVDIDDAIPWIVGTAKQVPLALVLAQETPTQLYKYLIGRGSLTVDNVYRDKLVTPTYSGTATGTTTSTVDLAAGDQESDDFYNNTYIEMDGEVRKITDYDNGNNRATVTPTGAWTAGAYTIRQWKTITEVINTVTYTLVEFSRRQRDTSEQMYQRDRMSADVTGLSTERNPSRYIETLLGLFPDVSLNAAGFTTAADAITTEGNLFVDGAIIRQKRVFDILDQVCKIGRLRLTLNDSGELYPIMDGTEDALYGEFIYNDNIIEIGLPEEIPLSELWKTLAIRYRLLFDEDDFRLTTAKHDVNTVEGRVDKEMDFDLIFDKTAADKVCDYLAKRKNSFDESIPVTLNHEARGRELGQLVKLQLNIPNKSGSYQIVKKELSSGGFAMDVIPYDIGVFQYVAGALPSDPVTDSQADFRFTPPSAVTGLAVVHGVTVLNVSANATLTWTNPTTNFKEVLVQYKKSADSVYNTFTTTSGEKAVITGLDVGTNYDFRIISFNQFDLSGGIAQILNSTTSGDTTAPATPTGLASTVKFGVAEWTWDTNSEDDIDGYEYDIRTASGGGGTLIESGITKDNAKAFNLNTGDLTSGVTRYLRVRAKDHSGNTSAYTSSVSASSNTILQDDITDGEVTGFWHNSLSSGSGSPLISLSATGMRAEPVVVHFSFYLTANAAILVTIKRDTTTLYQQLSANTVNPGYYHVSTDDTPSSGSHTYSVTMGNNPGCNDIELTVQERRR